VGGVDAKHGFAQADRAVADISVERHQIPCISRARLSSM
jgi:hypothetical protein